jgi:hypothetical protein
MNTESTSFYIISFYSTIVMVNVLMLKVGNLSVNEAVIIWGVFNLGSMLFIGRRNYKKNKDN